MVTAFAQETGIRYLSMWALDRDEPCISDAPIAILTCSGTKQEPLAFSRIFNQMTANNSEN
jgi:chitinase